MTGSAIDVEEVLGSLKDFQRRTAEWVFHRMFDDDDPATRFLVADEVGLGKTHVAKGVIALVIDHLERCGDHRQDIVYVCSNGAIARQNLRKLLPKHIKPIETVERLTMLPLAQLNERSAGGEAVNLLAITPGTSLQFGRETGRIEERALAYAFLRKHWSDRPFPIRARWVFWRGISKGDKKKGDKKLQFLAGQYAPLIAGQLGAFADAIKTVDEVRLSSGEPALRSLFDQLVDGLTSKQSFPKALVPLQQDLIGSVRRAMATVGIAMLQPDLVVLDEFQRFKDLLDPDRKDWAADLANRLFTHSDPRTGRATRTLLLSATPYRMYTTADENEADHYSDFIATCSFLFCDPERTDRLKRRFDDLRMALTDRSGVARAEVVGAAVAEDLRSVMVRTERLASTPDRDGMLRECDTAVSVMSSDLHSYLRTGALAEAVGHYEPSEYWKSGPYLFNFMENYKLKQNFDAAVDEGRLPDRERLQPGPGLLDWDGVDAYQPLDPENGRLRWLLDDLRAHNAFDLLWIPPSMRYYDAGTVYEGDPATSFTKRLVFSGWAVVPKVVSSLVSYEAERHAFAGQRSHMYTTDYGARGGQRLEFRLDGQRPGGMTAFLFVWPSPTLAELGDPRPRAGRERPTLARLLDQVRARLADRLLPLTTDAPTSGVVDQRWYWAAPLLLDQHHHPRVIDEWFGRHGSELNWTGDDAASGFLRHSEEAWSLLKGRSERLGRVPDDLVDVLAELAVGSPAVCALRALAATTGLTPASNQLLTAAARAAWAFRSFFNAPDVTAMVLSGEQDDSLGEREGGARYWRDAVRHGAGGNLQAVLDEHVHVLRDWLGFLSFDDDDARWMAAGAIAAQLSEALAVRTTSFRVEVPLQVDGVPTREQKRMRNRFAVAFGNRSLEEGGEARAESVSAGFNSPFWPFVLTSTSVGQEGLDFHLWCHSVVHWNLPTNPVDLEQREGRVHRFKGHAVRRNIAATVDLPQPSTRTGDLWDALFASAAERRSRDGTEMVPYWVFNDGPAKIERYAPVLPFSTEAAALPRLRRSLAAYRLGIGQARQEELLDFLGEGLTDDQLTALAQRLRIDLAPPITPGPDAVACC